VIKKAPNDQLLGCDGLVAVFFGEVTAKVEGKLQLVGPKAGEFSEVIVVGIWPRKGEDAIGFHCQIEFGGELEVNEVFRVSLAKQEVEFPDGGVAVLLNLQVAFKEFLARRVIEEKGEGVFVEVAQLLFEVEDRVIGRKDELMPGECRGFRKILDEKRRMDEALKKGMGHGVTRILWKPG